jgi:hypothetical protein
MPAQDAQAQTATFLLLVVLLPLLLLLLLVVVKQPTFPHPGASHS